MRLVRTTLVKRLGLALAMSVAVGLALVEIVIREPGNSTQAAADPQYRIRSASPMNHARVFASATTLASGQVLIAGGIDSSYNYLATAELFDPRSQTFMPLGQMAAARAAHSATLLPDGQVLIAGGLTCSEGKCTYLSSAEVYEPLTRRFLPVGSMTAARANQTATLLADGTVLIAGGSDGRGLASAETYDPLKESFTPTQAMTSPRFLHTATLLDDGHVLIVGGRSCQDECDDNSASGSAELYDPAGRRFSPTGKLNEARIQHNAALLPNGEVLISGGRSCKGDCEGDKTLLESEVYDPGTKSFIRAGAMIAARAGAQAVAMPNGQIFIYGGSDCARRGGCKYLNSAEIFMPDTGDFISAGNGTVAGLNCLAALLPNQQVLIAGGRVRGSISRNAEVFSLTGN